MKYAIIAAGEGSRLAQEGIDVPKPLVIIHGEHLIDRLIRIFMSNEAEIIVVICNDLRPEVSEHLRRLQDKGKLHEKPLPPLRFVVKTTPSSMHSFYELSQLLDDGSDAPFVLTTVDTIFREDEFKGYLRAFKQVLDEGDDGLMGVTDFIDDEKPLYVGYEECGVWSEKCGVRSEEGFPRITGFFDTLEELDTQHSTAQTSPGGMRGAPLISAGIYGLTPRAFQTLNDCIERGERRMRNFQRALVRDGLRLRVYPFQKVLDIDHASDIVKAEEELKNGIEKMKIIAIRRDARFSPNCSEKDRAILEAASREVCKRFEKMGDPCELRWVEERDFNLADEAEIYLSMARLPEALHTLEAFEWQGRRVVNRPSSVSNCQRSRLQQLMRENDIPMPESTLVFPVWLKRGDEAAQSEDDVVFCEDEMAFQQAVGTFQQRGIADYVVSHHVVGDIVKFYGVGDRFFRYFYPTDDGETKYEHEKINGPAHHYAFDASQLQQDVRRLAKLTGLEVYGGDAIVRPDGSYCIIDFNDWPSFSRCRDEAAEAIAKLINN